MPKVRMLLVAEIEVEGEHPADSLFLPEVEANERLDHFREAVLPSLNYGITLYRPTPRDMQEWGEVPEDCTFVPVRRVESAPSGE